MENKFAIHTDGGAIGNPGPAASAFVVYKDNQEIYHEVNKIGNSTNNIAEYNAVIFALEWLKKNYEASFLTMTEIDFYSDSQLLVSQLNGIFKIKNSNLRLLILKIKSLEQEIKSKIFYHHILREKNSQADALIKSVLK